MPNLLIDKLAFGGAGFGRIDGKACFVPYTAPGDCVDIAVTKNRSSYLEGTVRRIESPADCRVMPPCPVFGSCGGCNWQHVSYEMQCRQKEQIFAETMWRIARIERGVIAPLLAEKEPFAYRQRIQLKIYCAGGRLSLGFYRHGSHYVVGLPDGCAIARPELNRAIVELRTIIASSPEPDRVPQVDLSADGDGTVAALFHFIGKAPDAMYDYLAGLQTEVEHIDAIFLQVGKKDSIKSVFGPQLLGYILTSATGGELSMTYSVDSFSQVNFRQNRQIVDAVTAWTATRPVNKVLDLYCGNGNISLPLACRAGTVLGMESYNRSIELARHNARQNGIENADFICEESAEGVKSLAEERKVFDLVLLDPPRSGADAVARNLQRLKPSNIIYISCDPPTLGRDLAVLQREGFRVESIQPVDMFPQTYHLESVTFLQAV